MAQYTYNYQKPRIGKHAPKNVLPRKKGFVDRFMKKHSQRKSK